MDIVKLWIILCLCSCPSLSHQCPSYNIAKCGFNVIIWYLSGNGLFFNVCDCHQSVTMFFVWAAVLLLILSHRFIYLFQEVD